MRLALPAPAVGLLLLATAAPASAQMSAAAPPDPPPTLVIYREEVKPGKGAAHLANETNWAAMMAKAQWPTGWLGTTSMSGPSEAWFFTGYPSMEAYGKDQKAQDAAEGLRDAEKYSAIDGELLTRTTAMVGVYRADLSYQAGVALPKMRYFSVDTLVVKPGYANMLVERWREIVAAHTASKMDEHWAVYEITSGAQAGTFMFFYPMESLAVLDASGEKHRGAAYRDAVGERGRALNNQMTREAILSQQNRILVFNPKMSHLPKDWIDGDPAFWTVKPPPQPAPKK